MGQFFKTLSNVIRAKIVSNLRKIERKKNRWSKNRSIGIWWMCHSFLESWYLYGSKKFPAARPKPNSLPSKGQRSRGVLSQKNVRGCACQTSKIWLSLYHFFLLNFPPFKYTVFKKKKTPNFDLIGCFYNNLPQKTPNLCNLGSFSSDENPRSLYQMSRKSAPKGTHIISVYHVNVRIPWPKAFTMGVLTFKAYGNVPPKWVAFYEKSFDMDYILVKKIIRRERGYVPFHKN